MIYSSRNIFPPVETFFMFYFVEINFSRLRLGSLPVCRMWRATFYKHFVMWRHQLPMFRLLRKLVSLCKRQPARVAMNNSQNFGVSCAREAGAIRRDRIRKFSQFAAFKSCDKSPADSPTASQENIFTIFRFARWQISLGDSLHK